ncbi:hypothetical protein EVAR_92064_1 [Eumeta japonica]|uniref:Uncharacterized protein n=1 Tax=Eumeta variegata TaxID=151549 RepID=A0A4C1SYW4_EUMVA|nr:hypothetical protein EVAR_92064_1 [Eumeta japonica]
MRLSNLNARSQVPLHYYRARVVVGKLILIVFRTQSYEAETKRDAEGRVKGGLGGVHVALLKQWNGHEIRALWRPTARRQTRTRSRSRRSTFRPCTTWEVMKGYEHEIMFLLFPLFC